MNEAEFSADANEAFQPVMALQNEYVALLHKAKSIINQSGLDLIKTYVPATIDGDEDAQEKLDREDESKESPRHFASLVQDTQLDAMAQLQKDQKRACQLLKNINQAMCGLVESGEQSVKQKALEVSQKDSDLTIDDKNLEACIAATNTVFEEAIRCLGVHGTGDQITKVRGRHE